MSTAYLFLTFQVQKNHGTAAKFRLDGGCRDTEAMDTPGKDGHQGTRLAKPAAALDRLLTVEELAEILQVARIFVYRHASELGAIKVGRHLRFSAQAVQLWLEARRLAEGQNRCQSPVENELIDTLKERAKTRRAS